MNEQTSHISPALLITLLVPSSFVSRASTTNTGIATVYPTEQYEVTGATSTKHVYAGEDLIGNITASTLYSVHSDHLTGSNVVTNASSTLEELLDYFPYGKIRLDQATSTFKETRKYTGHTYDTDTELTYAKARYYDGKTGRFVSQDPAFNSIGTPELKQKTNLELEQCLSDPQQLNSYSYVKNNPLKHKDATGEFIDTILDVGFIVYDAYKIAQAYTTGQDSSSHIQALALDSVGALLPGVTGLGMMARVANKADDAMDAGKAVVKGVEKIEDVSKAANLPKIGEKISGVGVSKHAAEQAVERNINVSQIEKALKSETQYYDTKNRSILWVVNEGRRGGYSIATTPDMETLKTVQNFIPNLFSKEGKRFIKIP